MYGLTVCQVYDNLISYRMLAAEREEIVRDAH
jgi:hypothetical protein